ncbi:UDP-D-glucuronate 4-epimerase 3 [Striga asiatica]|uniref:UDP-D-glucuronate 4-epimerase 3 n=1 Tax=Striga asiatica TaxID=4170 RepID=A0A5A7QTU2_STRAF|nr:UDP-D-glucuronate 4-epimerase 3 [Striga asiatica]
MIDRPFWWKSEGKKLCLQEQSRAVSNTYPIPPEPTLIASSSTDPLYSTLCTPQSKRRRRRTPCPKRYARKIATYKLSDALNHQYNHLIPVECTLTTREGRRRRDIVRYEDIMTDNCLWFDRTSLTDFVVTVFTDNQVERDLRHHFTLQIKKPMWNVRAWFIIAIVYYNQNNTN